MTLPPPHMPVEETFNEFVKDFGGELVSELLSKNPAFDNADYIFRNLEEPVIAELKCLEKNQFGDDAFREKLRQLHATWVQKGLVSNTNSPTIQINTAVLPHVCAMDVFKLVKNPLERVIGKASDQIKATRSHFHLPDAKGLLILVNDGYIGLHPQQLVETVAWILTRQEKAGINSILFCTVNLAASMPGIDQDVLLWLEAYRSPSDALPKLFLQNFRDAWMSFFTRKICQHVPVFAVSDTELLARARNMPPRQTR